MAVLQADKVMENQKLLLQIGNLELLHYEFQFRALECESVLFSLQSQYQQDCLEHIFGM